MEGNEEKRKRSFGLLRQTFLVAGLIVLASAFLGAFVSEWWLLAAGLVGLGLLGAAITGRCTLTFLLSRLPFNPAHTGNIKKGSDLLNY
jgi:hypothetical protein